MIDIENLFSGKRKYLFGLIILLCTSAICVAFSMGDSDDFNLSKREVLFRRIGHEILLQSGDSTSRVLPVEMIAENEYQIGFANKLTFRPDSLVSMTRRLLAKDPLAQNYVVNVLNASNSKVVYGYIISKNRKDDLITCIGRQQPKASYLINIKFKSTATDGSKNGYLLGSLPFLAFVGFIFLGSVRPRKAMLENNQPTRVIAIGSVLFDAENRKLTFNGNTTGLTGTETRVLRIFASSPNETIERSRLQKEIWEDEGVIVGRSLDMFISKLRKKLEFDPNIRIVVIRGKGYRLEVNS